MRDGPYSGLRGNRLIGISGHTVIAREEPNSMPFRFDPHHWVDLADELRRSAECMNDQAAKAVMLRVADGYDGLAGRGKNIPANGTRPAAAL